MSLLREVRVETISELIEAMANATAKVMTSHGEDPESRIILAAAVDGFTRRVDECTFPGFRENVKTLINYEGD